MDKGVGDRDEEVSLVVARKGLGDFEGLVEKYRDTTRLPRVPPKLCDNERPPDQGDAMSVAAISSEATVPSTSCTKSTRNVTNQLAAQRNRAGSNNMF